jgi:predicted nucleotidyltransferase
MNRIKNIDMKEVIEVLNKAFTEFGVDFYLIGARARDFWLETNNIPIKRGTLDIDFAILVPNLDEFDAFKKLLETKYNFKLVRDILHRVVYIPKNIIIDLLPFGGIDESGYINFGDKSDSNISVIGFQEVFKNVAEGYLSDVPLKIASLPGICILKLISWSDRPFEREKDIVDINTIIQHFFEIESENIYNDHPDLFEVDDFDQLNAGARVLGRQMRSIISGNDKLLHRITNILKENTEFPDNSRIGDIIVRGTDKPVLDVILVFSELLKGIQD